MLLWERVQHVLLVIRGMFACETGGCKLGRWNLKYLVQLLEQRSLKAKVVRCEGGEIQQFDGEFSSWNILGLGDAISLVVIPCSISLSKAKKARGRTPHGGLSFDDIWCVRVFACCTQSNCQTCCNFCLLCFTQPTPSQGCVIQFWPCTAAEIGIWFVARFVQVVAIADSGFCRCQAQAIDPRVTELNAKLRCSKKESGGGTATLQGTNMEKLYENSSSKMSVTREHVIYVIAARKSPPSNSRGCFVEHLGS